MYEAARIIIIKGSEIIDEGWNFFFGIGIESMLPIANMNRGSEDINNRILKMISTPKTVITGTASKSMKKNPLSL